jgi:hypothetical protein
MPVFLSSVFCLRRDNGISGRVLVLLEEAEYTQDLGLTHLQAKNILSHLKCDTHAASRTRCWPWSTMWCVKTTILLRRGLSCSDLLKCCLHRDGRAY